MSRLGKDTHIFVAAHVTEIYGPVQALQNYLAESGQDFAFAACPFGYSKITSASATVYRQGKAVAYQQGHRNRNWGALQWALDALFMVRKVIRLANPRTVYIGINALNACVGVWLRRLRLCRGVVYYVIDYTPQRFESGLLNRLYQALCAFAARHADAVWNLSERMREVHAKFGTQPERSLLVPVGVEMQAVRPVEEPAIDRKRWVLVSALFENKGVQLALEALRHVPEARLVIIGTGPYEKNLKNLAEGLAVDDRVEFKGRLTHDPLFAYLPSCGLALAPYVPDPASYTYFADPTKPKEYLACGLPVVLTRVPWIAEVIAERPMGIAIAYDAKELAEACRKLMTDDAFWRQCRENALGYAKEIDWKVIFAKAMQETGALIKK